VRSLVGKVVVVTGGARGIGATTAAALAAKGARVAIGDIDVDLAERTAKEIGRDVLALQLDVTDRAGFPAFLDRVERELGPIGVLINNAGIMPLALLEEESEDSTARQIAINFEAVVRGTREAVRRMRPRGTGHIVNIASAAGRTGFPGAATYAATKHAVVGLSESVRYELRGSGVDVSCVMPTAVRTELASGLKKNWLVGFVDAEDVANAIVGALERPRFDVFVPRYLGWMIRVMRFVPRRVAEFVFVHSGASTLLTSAVHTEAREAYERRAAGDN
jgi:NAD(P)-dependent dehydrogenase (short-subunit alcohol dehydrogenase family)